MFTTKVSKSIFGILGLATMLSLGAAQVWAADNELIEKVPVTRDGDYCHLKFPAMHLGTLESSQPVLKNPGTGDVVDYYGSCDYNPTGKEEQWNQLWEWQHRFDG